MLSEVGSHTSFFVPRFLSCAMTSCLHPACGGMTTRALWSRGEYKKEEKSPHLAQSFRCLD